MTSKWQCNVRNSSLSKQDTMSRKRRSEIGRNLTGAQKTCWQSTRKTLLICIYFWMKFTILVLSNSKYELIIANLPAYDNHVLSWKTCLNGGRVEFTIFYWQ